MTTRLARLSRWSFYTGWFVGISYATLADQLDWPWWLLTAVASAIVFTLRWATDAIASHIARTSEPQPAADRDGRP